MTDVGFKRIGSTDLCVRCAGAGKPKCECPDEKRFFFRFDPALPAAQITVRSYDGLLREPMRSVVFTNILPETLEAWKNPQPVTQKPLTREKVIEAMRELGPQPKYNFPVLTGIEHGQGTPWTAELYARLIAECECPQCKRSAEHYTAQAARGELPDGTPLKEWLSLLESNRERVRQERDRTAPENSAPQLTTQIEHKPAGRGGFEFL